MEDKTAIGISDLLRQFIEALVEEVVIEGKPFDDQKKKWLQRYSQEEGVDYTALEKNLKDFFEVMEDWKSQKSRSSQIALKMLAKECYISESEMEKLFSTPSKAKNQNLLNGHEYVDLGLPSGTLWATCNVGANKPEDYGDYFAWGETCPNCEYNEDTNKYYEDFDPIKYTDKDHLKILQPEDDAARANWGAGWRMPTKEEWEELRDNTTYKWTKQNGVEGGLFTANNGNSLFLPAAGYRCDDEFFNAGDCGHYRSSSLYTGDPLLTWNFDCSSVCDVYLDIRTDGESVRSVCSAPQS